MFAIFEMQGHPANAPARGRSAFETLDSLIRSLSLTTLDLTDPRTCIFLPGQVPIVPTTAQVPPLSNASPPLAFDSFPLGAHHLQHDLNLGSVSHAPPAQGVQQWHCGCSPYSLGGAWPRSAELAPAWTPTPMWPESASEGEMQKEECRRLVWSTVMLTVAGSSYGAAGTDEDPEYLWIKDPANVSVSDLPSRRCVFSVKLIRLGSMFA